MPSFCCFWDPGIDYTERELTDECSICRRPLGAPLLSPPVTIADYRVLKPLDRGFYGAIYLVERGSLATKSVLKVIPQGVYEYFNKDFLQECRIHAEVAAGTSHLVSIRDAFDTDVDFGGSSLPCHVAVLDFIEGTPLSKYLTRKSELTAASIAQIAVDLFSLLAELENKRRFHNDLHDKNILIQSLPSDQRRAQAIDPTIRAVAVDLGSITDGSRSNDLHQTGDLHQVVTHLLSLAESLLARPQRISDIEYRLATGLQEIAHMLAPSPLNQRVPEYERYIQMIWDSFSFASSPWKERPDSLRRFDDSYNAQTMHHWFVPKLLVDPEDEWHRDVTVAGPQVITGMRGCGKTMLLRSLQFHSRASAASQGLLGSGAPLDALARDRYVGLYVSCTRLLDCLGSPDEELHHPYARLYLAYAREALRALRHLTEMEAQGTPAIIRAAHRRIAKAVAAYVSDADRLLDAESDLALERGIQDMLISLDRGEARHSLTAHATVAFPYLADAICAGTPIWTSARVFFLLDDVSTRHLHPRNIHDLISTLLFSNDRCAFKMTTEAQTLELSLKSPGLIEPAREGRDYDTLDLGHLVYERLRDRVEGRTFLSRILQQRADAYLRHPVQSPAELLGDTNLESIASAIASSSETAASRKHVYHGLGALAALCVGDIGDVVSIYELMLRKAGHLESIPFDREVQSTCFQEYCSRRLYHLNRRDGRLKDFALGFAGAAHDLLLQSARANATTQGVRRLRQYTSVYVRITEGDEERQFEQLQELMDAGVFVLRGGPMQPRSKTRDPDPIRQFILVYRKLFGLSSFIGLAERDRFELSGSALAEWLDNPQDTRAILTRNLQPAGSPDPTRPSDPDIEDAVSQVAPRRARPLMLWDSSVTPESVATPRGYTLSRMPRVQEIVGKDLGQEAVDTLIIAAGFEQRTLTSVRRLLKSVAPARAVLVRYKLLGKRRQIKQLLDAHIGDVVEMDYEELATGDATLPAGRTLIDVSGLAKPLIFKFVRDVLVRDGAAWIAYTAAKSHYPLNKDIERVLETEASGDPYERLEALSKVWPGERGPYTFVKLLSTDADDARQTLLCAAASPKAERLLSLVEEREFNRIDLIEPLSDSPRSRLARLAAEVAMKSYDASDHERIGSDDLREMLRFMADRYDRFYVHGNYDFELGLTGSKLHTVACAAASVALRIAQCWYVRPDEFDPKRFTQGVGDSRYFRLERVDP